MLAYHASMLEALGAQSRRDRQAETIAARHHPDPSNLAAGSQRRRKAWRQRGVGEVPDGLGGSGRGPGPPVMENLTMAKNAIQKIAMNAAENIPYVPVGKELFL